MQIIAERIKELEQAAKDQAYKLEIDKTGFGRRRMEQELRNIIEVLKFNKALLAQLSTNKGPLQ